MKDFCQFKVLEKAHQLALAVYRAPSKFPKEELYGLTSQTRRLILAHDLEFPANQHYEKLHSQVAEVKRMLASLLKTLRADR